MISGEVGAIEAGIYKISHSPYELKFLPKYFSFQEKRNGTLLRIQDSEGHYGYADLHQWPLNFESEQSRLSLQTAETDLYFRKKKQSVWNEFSNASIENLNIGIKNNYLLVNFASESDSGFVEIKNELAQAIELGFKVVKVKAGKNLDFELSRLQKLIGDFPSLQWRLDFNSALTYKDARSFFSKLNAAEISKIEYVEDPTSYNSSEWMELNKIIPLAFDQPTGVNGSVVSLATDSFRHLVLKPALQNTDSLVEWALENNKKLTVTSFMDHPLGQANAFYKALQIKSKLGIKAGELLNVCGLRTQFLFTKTEFSNEIENSKPQLLFPKGIGFGFDQQLRNLKWLQLN